MRIGVVCEGPTDYYAISNFLGASLRKIGIEAFFISIQPELDNTQPAAGWGNVFVWLDRYPPLARIQKFFNGGLFAGDLAEEPYSCILIQLDSDILGEPSFASNVFERYGHIVVVPVSTSDRATEIRNVIRASARFAEMTENDVKRHVIAPAVESTEAWCVAAFTAIPANCGTLRGQTLTDQFMQALERSEGRPAAPSYASINKDVGRRMRFCERHAGNHQRIADCCEEFKVIRDELVGLNS